MSKPKEINIEGKDYFAWAYEEQTKIKHKVLGSYSKIWLAKLGKYYDTMFFDCHAGCGAYMDEKTKEVQYGSSFIVQNMASELNLKRKSTNYICACEIDKHYFNNYKSIINDVGGKTISLKNDDFQNVMQEVLVKKYYCNHPTLFFVDPFGYSMKMSSIGNMMRNNKNEVFINFMFDWISRFLAVTNEAVFDEFFGSHEWINANNLNGSSREEYLIDLYKKEVKKATGARYVYAYRLCFADKNRTYYYLVHATNNIQGITYMKDSFASANNGRIEYLGKKQDLISLFDLTVFKTTDFSEKALRQFEGKTLTFEEVWESVAEIVPYTSKDLSEAIVELEKSNKITIERVSSKRGQYHDKDILIFGDEI